MARIKNGNVELDSGQLILLDDAKSIGIVYSDDDDNVMLKLGSEYYSLMSSRDLTNYDAEVINKIEESEADSYIEYCKTNWIYRGEWDVSVGMSASFSFSSIPTEKIPYMRLAICHYNAGEFVSVDVNSSDTQVIGGELGVDGSWAYFDLIDSSLNSTADNIITITSSVDVPCKLYIVQLYYDSSTATKSNMTYDDINSAISTREIISPYNVSVELI